MRISPADRPLTDDCRELVARAWCGDYMPVARVFRLFDAGDWSGFEARDGQGLLRGILLYTIARYPHGLELEVQVLSGAAHPSGGSFARDFAPYIIATAEQHKCARIEIRSEHRAMGRILEGLGFQLAQTIYRREV